MPNPAHMKNKYGKKGNTTENAALAMMNKKKKKKQSKGVASSKVGK